jgi:hypothetical protein
MRYVERRYVTDYEFWSALTPQRFGLWRLAATVASRIAHTTGRDRSRPTKALTGQRTPKIVELNERGGHHGCCPPLFFFCLLPSAYCLLLTAYCLLFLVSARETGVGPYQPSMTLAALTAFFS